MSNPSPITHELSLSSIWRIILLLALVWFLYELRDIIMILLFAIIIASGVTPFANWLDKKRFPRLLGVALLYLSVFVLIAFVISLMVPFISAQINQLIQDLPNFINKVSDSLDKVQDSRYVDLFSEAQNLLDSASGYLQAFSGSVFGFIVNIFGGLVSFAAIIIISFYLSVMRNGVESFIRSVVPREYEGIVTRVWRRAETKVGKWLQGQMLLALIVGLAVYIVMSLMGIKFALLLGFLAMVLELVPHVGPVLAAIPAIVLGFSTSATLGIWVIVAWILIQQIENHILVPLILGKSVGLHPVIVIVSLLIGAKLAGILGMVLAVPVAAVVVEILEELMREPVAEAKVE